MMGRIVLGAVALGLLATPVVATPVNDAPPSGAVFALTGLKRSNSYKQYSFSFVAGQALTDLTFAMRDDDAFLYLDDISMVLAGTTMNLVTNGTFEKGKVGNHAPTGWTYLNPTGVDETFSGQLSDSDPHKGGQHYLDSAAYGYDAISQAIATTIGQTYTVSFWVHESRSFDTYQPVSTDGGAVSDLLVYAQAGTPVFGQVPEPASWALMIAGFGAIGIAGRRRRAACEALPA